jgi:hypothetical protein
MLAGLEKIETDLADPNSARTAFPVPDYAKNRHRSIKPEFLVTVGICTHLGCSPVTKFETGNQPGLGTDWPRIAEVPFDARHRFMATAHTDLDAAKTASRNTPSHLPLSAVRPGSRLLETERKLLTHAIRMSAYNSESALARLLRPHYSRGHDETRALLREAFTLPGDIQIIGNTLHIRLDPASAPRRSNALAALCTELTQTQTPYPDTNLTLAYSIKGHPAQT